MADNTNYIGVAMGLDVTDLKAGLSEANKQIQLANSEFKAASSGMDDWAKSTEGISAKVKQLDSVLKMQKSKLQGLTAEYERVAKEQGESSDAARKLKVQINNQQAVVNKTEAEFKGYSKILQEAEEGTLDLEKATIRGGKVVKSFGDEAKNAGGKFGGLKSVAKGVVGGIAAIGGAAAAGVGSLLSLAESTRTYREDMNKLETGFTTAGHSAEAAQSTYQALFGVLGEEDQATEAAAHLAQLANSQEDLSKWTNIATGVYATFGKSLPIENLTEAANETSKTGKITGGLADALNWAGVSEDEFQSKLDACSSEQERQALITNTLNGLYSEQSAKFKELNGDVMKAREADAALTQTMAELGAIAEPIMTTLKLLAVDLLGAIKPFIEMIGTGLTGALQGSASATDTLAQGLGGILNALVGKVTEMLPMITGVLVQLIPAIVNTLLGALPELVNVVTTLVTQIINMLAVMLPQVAIKIVEIIPQIINSLLAAIPQLLQAAITLLMAIVQAVPQIVTMLVAALPSIINSIINAVVQAIPLLLDAAIQLLMAIIQAIPTIIQALVTNLPKIINAIIDGVLGALPLLLNAAIELLMAIVEAIPKILPALISATPKIISTIISTLGQNIPKILTAAVKLFMAIVQAIPKIVVELVKSIPQIIKAIVSALKNGSEQMRSAGLDLLKGIWEGIKGGAKWLKDKISGFAGDVAGWFKKTFKIKSPSRLMRDEVGKYIGQGVGVGILDSIPSVKKNLGQFAGFIQDNIGGIKGGLSLGYADAGAGAYGSRSTVVNAGLTVNYNGSMSLKQTKKLQDNHYRAIHTKLKAEGAI